MTYFDETIRFWGRCFPVNSGEVHTSTIVLYAALGKYLEQKQSGVYILVYTYYYDRPMYVSYRPCGILQYAVPSGK